MRDLSWGSFGNHPHIDGDWPHGSFPSMSESLSKDRGRRDPIFHKLIYTSSSKLPSLISKVSGAPSEKRVHLCRKHVWSEASGTSGGGRGPSNDCEHFLHWQSDQQFLVLPRLPKPVNCKKSKQPGAKLHPWRKAIPGPESQGVSQEPGAKAQGCQGLRFLCCSLLSFCSSKPTPGRIFCFILSGISEASEFWLLEEFQGCHLAYLTYMQSESVESLVVQLCLSLSDLMDCSPPGSSVHGILQARILEWLPFPSPGDLPDPGIEPRSPALQADSLTSEWPGKPRIHLVKFWAGWSTSWNQDWQEKY